MRLARSSDVRPLSVSDRRRELRGSSGVPRRASSRVSALDTVAFDRLRSAAAREKEPSSATFAKIAQASKSGRYGIANPETMVFHRSYFGANEKAYCSITDGVRGLPFSVLKGVRTMIEVRPFASLGGANHGWLDAKHHFSFGGHHDPARLGGG